MFRKMRAHDVPSSAKFIYLLEREFYNGPQFNFAIGKYLR